MKAGLLLSLSLEALCASYEEFTKGSTFSGLYTMDVGWQFAHYTFCYTKHTKLITCLSSQLSSSSFLVYVLNITCQ
jgi:hypothetical protein